MHFEKSWFEFGGVTVTVVLWTLHFCFSVISEIHLCLPVVCSFVSLQSAPSGHYWDSDSPVWIRRRSNARILTCPFAFTMVFCQSLNLWEQVKVERWNNFSNEQPGAIFYRFLPGLETLFCAESHRAGSGLDDGFPAIWARVDTLFH